MDASNVLNFISNNVPLVIDIALIIVLLICVIRGYIKGFLASAFDLAGSLGGILGAWYVSSHYSSVIFESLLRNTLIERAYNYLVQAREHMSGSIKEIDVGTALGEVIGRWFNSFAEGALSKAGKSLSDMLTPTMESAEYLVDEFAAPIIVGVITLVVFILCFLIIKLVCSALSSITKSVNDIPVIGTANQVAGFMAGIVIGAVYIIILSSLFSMIVMVTKDSLPHFNGEILSRSFIMKLTSFLNPFMGK